MFVLFPALSRDRPFLCRDDLAVNLARRFSFQQILHADSQQRRIFVQVWFDHAPVGVCERDGFGFVELVFGQFVV